MERLIAHARLFLGGAALVAIWLDPVKHAPYQQSTYAVLASYVAYAAAVSLVAWRWAAPPRWLGLVTHVVDLAAFTFLMYVTEGAASPFFVYVVFALLCAGLRWQWRGVLWTGLVALAMFVGLGLYATKVLEDPAFGLNVFLIRSVYLVVLAVIVGANGAPEARIRGDLAMLAEWPLIIPSDIDDLLGSSLLRAARVVRAPRIVLAWDEPDEPWLNLAWIGPGGFARGREVPGTYAPLVPEPLATASFVCNDATAVTATVLHRTGGALERWTGRPVHDDLGRRFAMKAVVSAGIQGHDVQGRLFWLDAADTTIEALATTEIAAYQVGAQLELFYALRRLQAVVAMEERRRLARDLHDGLLQSLVVIDMKLAALERSEATTPGSISSRMLEFRALLSEEHAALRSFIDELRPGARRPAVDFAQELDELVESFRKRWGLRVDVRRVAVPQQLEPRLEREICLLLREALVNVARHAGASTARVDVAIADRFVHIVVTDDGRGFAFRGRREYDELVELDEGPVTLRERVSLLHGTLAIDSSDQGTRVEIRVPIPARVDV